MALYEYNGEKGVSVPLFERGSFEDIVLSYFGLGRFAVLNHSGKIIAHVIENVRDTHYTRALDEVKTEEDGKLLPDGTTSEVMRLMFAGEFDDSDWALWYGVEEFRGSGVSEI